MWCFSGFCSRASSIFKKLKTLNKLVNDELKYLVNWINASKVSLNVKKPEIMIFKSKEKKFEGDLKVKYLGVKIDSNLSWGCHVNDLSVKLNRVNILLFRK